MAQKTEQYGNCSVLCLQILNIHFLDFILIGIVLGCFHDQANENEDRKIYKRGNLTNQNLTDELRCFRRCIHQNERNEKSADKGDDGNDKPHKFVSCFGTNEALCDGDADKHENEKQ